MNKTQPKMRQTPRVQKDSLSAWVFAIRPVTLLVGMMPVVVGTAVAHRLQSARLFPALAALFGAIFIQIGTNLANDVLDFEKGADTQERLGPLRVTQAGLLAPNKVRLGMYLSFAAAACLGLYLCSVAGPSILLIGTLSILSGIAYTGGPYPLGYNGLGDLFVFVFFGLVAVCGTVFVQTQAIPTLAIWAAVPMGALATAVLAVNNLRDGPTDVKANKRTLVVRFGRGFGIAEYLLLLAGAYLVPILLFTSGRCGRAVLLPLFSLPLALPLSRSIRCDTGAVLNRTLAGTARLLLVYGLFFALGIAW